MNICSAVITTNLQRENADLLDTPRGDVDRIAQAYEQVSPVAGELPPLATGG